VDVDLAIDGDVDTLPDPHQTCVYRVVQEALTNCVRHSKAQSIAVGLRSDGRMLNVSVTDDGVGFDPRARRDGLGLRGIEERGKELGGALAIRTSPGGTVVAMELPLSAPVPEARLARIAG
jgi:signal transduction histidine kinase